MMRWLKSENLLAESNSANIYLLILNGIINTHKVKHMLNYFAKRWLELKLE